MKGSGRSTGVYGIDERVASGGGWRAHGLHSGVGKLEGSSGELVGGRGGGAATAGGGEERATVVEREKGGGGEVEDHR